jgi:hypothetical protein
VQLVPLKNLLDYLSACGQPVTHICKQAPNPVAHLALLCTCTSKLYSILNHH